MSLPLNNCHGEKSAPFFNKPAILGYGCSGQASSRALCESGIRVKVWDDRPEAREKARKDGHFAPETQKMLWEGEGITGLIVSPGVPPGHRLIIEARARGCAVGGDIDLLQQACPHARFVGITGTNGKSTVTALTAHILQHGGIEAIAGGNIGVPALALPPLGTLGVYVLEVSSYQLSHSAEIGFDIAVLLNIAVDHLDYHGSMERYIAAKTKIFDNFPSHAVFLTGVDDPLSQMIFKDLCESENTPTPVPFSGCSTLIGGISVSGKGLVERLTPGRFEECLCLEDSPALPGAHNAQNIAAAWGIARALGVAPAEIRSAVASFRGLPHRLQEIARFGSIRFIDDSKATNPHSVLPALECFENIYWIAGGRAKSGAQFSVLDAALPRIRRGFFIGEAAGMLHQRWCSRLPSECYLGLDEALEAVFAHIAASPDEAQTVLLSPGCASFDQFVDFRARGRYFSEWVQRYLKKREERQ